MLERDALKPKQTGALPCEAWEALLADVLDGNLPSGDRAIFDQHTGACTACAQLLIEAQRGREWMKFLEEEPEGPADLVDKILLRTQGLSAGTEIGFVQGGAIPVNGMTLPSAGQMPPALLPRVSPMVLERAFHDARLLMTAAMAFFVIALTLSLLGFRLDTVKAAELKPQTLEANVTKQVYQTKKQVVSFYDNLRVVYEVESKMKELRRDSEPEAAPAAKPKADSSKPQVPARTPAATPETSRQQSVRGLPVMAWDCDSPEKSNTNDQNERSRA